MIPNAPRSLDFDLGETADLIRDTVSSFAQDRIAPMAADIDRNDAFPRELWTGNGRARRARALPSRKSGAGPASVILSMSWRWRRSAGRLPR